MQAKIEGLTTTNALMKEDLSICQNALFKSQEDNKKLFSQVGNSSDYSTSTDKVINLAMRSQLSKIEWSDFY